jgi:hypothetical protein
VFSTDARPVSTYAWFEINLTATGAEVPSINQTGRKRRTHVGMGRSGQRGLAVLVIAGLGLVLTACGGDDDDAAPAATDGGGNADDNADANADENADDNGGGGDISDDCKDLLGDYLEKLEPFVKDVDWESASLDTMSQIQEQMGNELSSLDSEISDQCDDYDFTTNADQMQEAIDIAQDRAPGTVAWLEFIQRLSTTVSSMSGPDLSGGDNTGGDNGDNGGGGDAGDVPQDCDGAIGYMEDLMGQYDHMADMALNDLTAMSNANQVITTQCSLQQMNDFFQRNDVQEWMSGT